MSDRYSFVCNAGCGVCSVKVRPFECERTETLEGEHLGSKYEPQIVSSCCGSAVHVYDNEADQWGAEVTIAALAHTGQAVDKDSLTAEAAPAGEVVSAPDKLWCETCEGGGMIIHQVRGDCSCPDCDGKGYWTRATPATEPSAPGYVSERAAIYEEIAQEFDRRDNGAGGFYEPYEPAHIIRALAAASTVQGKDKP